MPSAGSELAVGAHTLRLGEGGVDGLPWHHQQRLGQR